MAGLLYFRPGSVVKPTPQEIAALGLTFDHPPSFREVVGSGPSGTTGVAFADPVRMGDWSIGVYPDQHWEPLPFDDPEPSLYIGWYDAAKPGPADLARDRQVPGKRLTLADGNEWLVPIVQEWHERDEVASPTLPRYVRRAKSGHWVYGDVEPRYQAIWNAAGEFWAALLQAAEATPPGDKLLLDYPPLFDFACQLIVTNYALTPDEISALRLFTSDSTAGNVATVAVDWPTFVAWLEKKSEAALASAASSPGPAAPPAPPSDPPSPTTPPLRTASTS